MPHTRLMSQCDDVPSPSDRHHSKMRGAFKGDAHLAYRPNIWYWPQATAQEPLKTDPSLSSDVCHYSWLQCALGLVRPSSIGRALMASDVYQVARAACSRSKSSSRHWPFLIMAQLLKLLIFVGPLILRMMEHHLDTRKFLTLFAVSTAVCILLIHLYFRFGPRNRTPFTRSDVLL